MKNKKTDMKNRFADTGKSYAGYFLRFVFCLVLTAAASLAQAQNRNQVSGKVTDKAGEPLIGATVVVVGTTTGATTGADGRFTIGVPAGGELKISYIGYVEQTVKVSAQSVLDIVLEEDSQMLKDVVVIGYGTMEKKSVTSSISSIKGDDLVAGMGGSTIATALQGKIPGLTISGSASPNSSNDFQLRGVASVNASKGPLVIIDGIPGGDMRALNQEDIESVDVLKDASAGAIYGTRAAGGVILVTTKQARQGRVTARYTGEFSVEAIRKTPDLLSSSEYVEYGLGEDYGHDTDWYKANDMWPTNGIWQPGYGSVRNVNPDLKWEEKSELNFGLDFSLFDDRLWGKFDIYHRKVDDMLYEVNAPMPPMVHDTVMKNIGSLENKGWEFELGGDIVRSKNFRYTSSLRLSHNKSKIKRLGDDGYFLDQVTFPSPGNPGTAVRLQNDVEIGQFFVYKYAGLDEDGKWMIYDKNNEIVPAVDGTKSNLVAENKHFVGNAIPKVILSWDHTFRYKNWDLSVFLRSWLDYDVFSQVNMYYGLANDSQLNVLKSAYTRNRNIKDEKILCDYWIDDASFLKIDAINLGYTLDLKRWTRYIQSAKIYLTIRDVAVFTDYNGINPEVDINGLNPGFEYVNNTASMYPQTTRFTLGVQLTF